MTPSRLLTAVAILLAIEAMTGSVAPPPSELDPEEQPVTRAVAASATATAVASLARAPRPFVATAIASPRCSVLILSNKVTKSPMASLRTSRLPSPTPVLAEPYVAAGTEATGGPVTSLSALRRTVDDDLYPQTWHLDWRGRGEIWSARWWFSFWLALIQVT